MDGFVVALEDVCHVKMKNSTQALYMSEGSMGSNIVYIINAEFDMQGIEPYIPLHVKT